MRPGFTRDYNYAGIFHFRFCWSSEWMEVLVDDRLPYLDGQSVLVYSNPRVSSAPRQYWASLVHKAYAKCVSHTHIHLLHWYRLHGNVESVNYVDVPQLLAEMTGGVTEVINIKTTYKTPVQLTDGISRLCEYTTLCCALAVCNCYWSRCIK